MYERTFWLDHVEDQSGEVIQEGTPLDQAHFNKKDREDSCSRSFIIHDISTEVILFKIAL